MSDELELEQEGDTDLVKQLRKQLRDTAKAKKDAEDRAAAASTALGAKTLAEVLAAKNLNPKIANFIVKDGVDATDEAAVETWLTENAELFGVPAATPAEQSTVPEDEQEAYRLMSSFQHEAATSPPDKVAKVTNLDVSKYKPGQDLKAAIMAAGAG